MSLAAILGTAAGWPPSTTAMWRTAEQVVPARSVRSASTPWLPRFFHGDLRVGSDIGLAIAGPSGRSLSSPATQSQEVPLLQANCIVQERHDHFEVAC